MKPKIRANRNQTLSVRRDEIITLKKNLLSINKLISVNEISNKTINQDLFDTIKFLPENFIDLLFIDPPYNLTKNYNGNIFKSSNEKQYEQWVDSWMSQLIKSLKKTASIYVCCDWKSSSSIYNVISKYFTVRNRITWEREKGRGAMSNWKNCSEDIWFATVSDNYFFDTNKVKLKKKVIAPYKDNNGVPKDWTSDEDGKFRLTYPSNIWTDITIPFWSMPENTDHPTQKPEKLVAKIILASTKEGDMIFDP
ncbi:site-specific DNA-methyltransferase, partial [Candidatus Beckwithbacteria bacterium CG23_combo_of_CG06-09_8_20_14_all_34_8]